MKKTIALQIMIAGALLAAATPALAQAYRSQLHFLEKFAVRQYEQGDKANAMKEFQRILRIDPDNALAREYLLKIGSEAPTPAVTGEQRLDRAITDIVSVKADLNEYEKDAKDLEYMIRNLITENDALYQALYKRSREVVELREKFYGTPYADAYAAVIKDIPIDRVPQRLHPSNDILPDEPPTAPAIPAEATAMPVAIDQKEIDALIADIATLNKRKVIGSPIHVTRAQAAPVAPEKHKMPEKDTAAAPQPASTTGAIIVTPQARPTPPSGRVTVGDPVIITPALNDAIEARREAVIEKTIAVLDKRDNLIQLKDELTDINTQLKTSNDRYINALTKIDSYYSRIKGTVAKKNFEEQKMFNELLADYADKIKEIETLKASVLGRDKAMTAFKSTLAKNAERIEKTNLAMALRDQQSADLKAMLLKYKNTLAEREALIKEQQKGLALTDKGLTGVNSQVATIEGALKQGDGHLSQLKARVTRIKQLEEQNVKMSVSLEESEKALQEAVAYISSLERQLGSARASLQKGLFPVNDADNKALRERIMALETSLRSMQADLDATTTSLNALTIREQGLLKKINDHELLQDKILSLNNTISILKKENADLQGSLSNNEKMKKDILSLKADLKKRGPMARENAALRETILKNTADAAIRAREFDALAKKMKDITELCTEKDKQIAAITEELRQIKISRLPQVQPPVRRAQDKNAEADLAKRLRQALDQATEAEARMTRAVSDAAEAKEKLILTNTALEKLRTDAANLEAMRIAAAKDKAALADMLASQDGLKRSLQAMEAELTMLQEGSREKEDQIALLSHDKKTLMTQIGRLTGTPLPGPATPSDKDLQLVMDLKEKEAQIAMLRDQLAAAGLALNASEEKLMLATAKAAAGSIKQEAIDNLLNQRDLKVAELSNEVLRLQKKIAELQKDLDRLKAAKK